MAAKNLNSFQTKSTLTVGNETFSYHSLPAFEKNSGLSLRLLPFSLKILLENLLRQEDGVVVKKSDLEKIAQWKPEQEPKDEIQFMPARVLLQDFTGVPAIADLAAMRAALTRLGGDPQVINPLQPADLVIDHSVQVDFFGNPQAFAANAQREFERNAERYQFLKWGQQAFKNFRVVPPDTGIVHQVNLEYLASVAMTSQHHGETWIYPDTVIGTDSHTTMINGLGVLGWGVGGIEAEAALLGQPCSMLIPQVVGFKLDGKLKPGTTATDLVLTVTQMLRKAGVVGRFVEFFGPGLSALSLADRATLANMAPEYGATMGLFPVDAITLDYLELTGRKALCARVQAYFQAQNLWYDPQSSQSVSESCYTKVLQLKLQQVEPCLAGPSRPQDRVLLTEVSQNFAKALPLLSKNFQAGAKARIQFQHHSSPTSQSSGVDPDQTDKINYQSFDLKHGAVVIAAITSCTNTSNPSVMIAAGLLAQKAVACGLQVKPWVKTSLAPGSKVVTDYLVKANLMSALEKLNFHLVGYGCTTCIGNSGPLSPEITQGINEQHLTVAAVLSGNRNFEGRINPLVRANYLASPPLVVAYALAGSVEVNFEQDPIGHDFNGDPVFLRDLWPTIEEINRVMKESVTEAQFANSYQDVLSGSAEWKKLVAVPEQLFQWESSSTYIQEPPFFQDMTLTPKPRALIDNARVLAVLGDSVTTDHISPAGSFAADSPAGKYLLSLGVPQVEFNSYGARRGNHQVMMRGTFANTRIKNHLTPEIEGGFTRHLPSGVTLPIFDAAMQYQKEQTPLMILAGKEYGTGSSRDWAAKGPQLLGIRVVIAESFERIHRSNLVGMGILPLQFQAEQSASSLGLSGEEYFSFAGLDRLTPGQKLEVSATVSGKSGQGQIKKFTVLVRIDTPNELEYFNHGGILLYVLRQTLALSHKS